ncbi:hypothetical protein ACFL1B_06385 [Nanoarchaeota archaeon]
MTKVLITEFLFKKIQKRFRTVEANEIIDKLESLEKNPQRGDILSNVGGFVIKEVKHKKFRFYCITDGHILKFGTNDELANLLIKFVRMSEKKDQQKTIDNIKSVLKSMGFDAW